MRKYWIAVACQEHVERGVAGHFMQVCHGKAAPLQQMQAGDFVIYYSPTVKMRDKASRCQSFTALGQILPKEPYLFEMSESFIPWRRDVNFKKIKQVAIGDVLDQLSFIRDKARWGYPFRRGYFSIPESDFFLIAKHMGDEDWMDESKS